MGPPRCSPPCLPLLPPPLSPCEKSHLKNHSGQQCHLAWGQQNVPQSVSSEPHHSVGNFASWDGSEKTHEVSSGPHWLASCGSILKLLVSATSAKIPAAKAFIFESRLPM